MKFAHMGDCHLGAWRQPELKELNFKSFQLAIERCIKERVEFVLITGDLFDNPYPPIETLKDAFGEFRKLYEANIPVFMIAGSHDYSVSGKTFLDVLEKAGFSKSVSNFEEKSGNIILQPTIYKNVALYGYSGKKSGMEVDEIERIKIQDSPGLFKILLLHTAIRDALNNPTIKAVDHRYLPKVDYLAMSHLHIVYAKEGRVYSGPTFPNNIIELEELKGGSFYIFDNGVIKRQELKIKPVVSINLEIKNALTATEEILSKINEEYLKDAILILKIAGFLEKGKTSDIDFAKIESFAKSKGVYVLLRSTSRLLTPEPEINLESLDSQNIESEVIKKFEENNPGKFNSTIIPLLRALHIEKEEDEKSSSFEERLMSETKKVLNL